MSKREEPNEEVLAVYDSRYKDGRNWKWLNSTDENTRSAAYMTARELVDLAGYFTITSPNLSAKDCLELAFMHFERYVRTSK